MRSEQSRSLAARWAVVVLLALAALISYIDRINLASALPEIRKSIPLSPEASGVLLSSFFWMYTFLQVPAGWVVDRYGVRWPFTFGLLLWSMVSASTALAATLGEMIAARLLLGFGESIVTPGAMHYIRMKFPEQNRGLAIGIFLAGTKWGPAIGAPVAAYLVAAYGWRPMFVMTGLGGLIWLLPWLLIVKKKAHDWAPPRLSIPNEPPTTDTVSWKAVFSTPVIWGILLGTFCYNYFVYFCMTWMPTYFKERNQLSLTGSGWFTFLSFGGMAIIAMLAGFVADLLIARGREAVTVRKSFTIAGFLVASSAVIAVFTDSRPIALCVAVLSLSGLGLTTANYWGLTQTLMPASAIGTVAGLQNTAANLAGIAAPWLTGIMVQQTGRFDAPLMALGFWMAVGVASYVFLVRQPKKSEPTAN